MTNDVSRACQRNPSVELYRVLLMFLIVLHHSAYHGMWAHERGLDAAWPSIYWLFTAMTIWHVDGFLSITGWFGTQFSIGRFLRIYGVIAFYSVLSIAFGLVSFGMLSSDYLSGGWFGKTYLYFLFLTPVLNAAIDHLRGSGKLYAAWMALDIAVVLNWAPGHLLSFVAADGAHGNSIMTFIVVYVNARFLHVSGALRFVSKLHVLIPFGLFAVGLGLNAAFGLKMFYNSPLVMMTGLAGLVFFLKFVRLPSWLARAVKIISPCTFGIYILHDSTSFGHFAYLLPQRLLSGYCENPLCVIFASAISCFVLCLCIDLVRRAVVGPVWRRMSPLLERIDRRIGF